MVRLVRVRLEDPQTQQHNDRHVWGSLTCIFFFFKVSISFVTTAYGGMTWTGCTDPSFIRQAVNSPEKTITEDRGGGGLEQPNVGHLGTHRHRTTTACRRTHGQNSHLRFIVAPHRGKCFTSQPKCRHYANHTHTFISIINTSIRSRASVGVLLCSLVSCVCVV